MNNTNLKAVASEFGMSFEKFWYFIQARGIPELPGQAPDRFYEEQDANEATIDFNLSQLRKCWAWKRIQRAARFAGETVQEFLTNSIMEMVRCLEDDMLLSPKTGEPICNNGDLYEVLKRARDLDQSGEAS